MVADMSEEKFKVLADQISPADLKRLAEAEQRGEAPAVRFPADVPPSKTAISFDASWTADDEENLRDMALAGGENVADVPPQVKWWDIWGNVQIIALSLGLIGERTVHKTADAKTRFDRLPMSVRRAYLSILALLILIAVGFFLGSKAYEYVKSRQGPFLDEALVAPYDLVERAAPSSGASASSLMPASIGSYMPTGRPITQLAPSSPTNQCLLGIGYSREETNPPLCQRSYGVLSTTGAKYKANNRFVDVTITQFLSDDQAAQTMMELFYHVRRYGQVGNFAIDGVSDVDYFYSSVRGWVSFTWARGPWIFSISSNRVSTIEDVLKQFPY